MYFERNIVRGINKRRSRWKNISAIFFKFNTVPALRRRHFSDSYKFKRRFFNVKNVDGYSGDILAKLVRHARSRNYIAKVKYTAAGTLRQGLSRIRAVRRGTRGRRARTRLDRRAATREGCVGGAIYSILRLPLLYDDLNVCTVNWLA